LTPTHGDVDRNGRAEILTAAQREALAKLQAEKQAIDNKLADVERALLKETVGRRKRQRQR
jgi:hypothetical protein